MKNNEATLFVFIACIIIGILITSNLNFSKSTKTVFLNSRQYEQQYNYKNVLTSQVDELRSKYMDLSQKLNKLENNKDAEGEVKAIQDELNSEKELAGETNVEGEGVVITINDGTDKFRGKVIKTNEDLEGLIHNFDIDYIVNDLRSAGAEAISVNGLRVVNSTEIYCTGPFIRINGVTAASPFTIRAIGNKDQLKDYMTADSNFLHTLLKYRGINGSITQSDDVKIEAYDGDLDYNYLKAKN